MIGFASHFALSVAETTDEGDDEGENDEVGNGKHYEFDEWSTAGDSSSQFVVIIILQELGAQTRMAARPPPVHRTDSINRIVQVMYLNIPVLYTCRRDHGSVRECARH